MQYWRRMELHGFDPQGEAMQELVRLAAHEDELRARVDEIGRAARAAQEELVASRDAVVEA